MVVWAWLAELQSLSYVHININFFHTTPIKSKQVKQNKQLPFLQLFYYFLCVMSRGVPEWNAKILNKVSPLFLCFLWHNDKNKHIMSIVHQKSKKQSDMNHRFFQGNQEQISEKSRLASGHIMRLCLVSKSRYWYCH